MANKIKLSGRLYFTNPYNRDVSYEVNITGNNTAMDIWIIGGPTYGLASLTLTYNGKSVVLEADDEYGNFTHHLYQGEFFYKRGQDKMKITGKLTDGNPAVFSDGSTTYTLQWETLNTEPTAEISSDVPVAGRTCAVNWFYSDADGDAVSLVNLIRYYKAEGASNYQKTTLLTSGTATEYTDTIPAGYGGGTLYYEITYTDAYGGTGKSATKETYVISNKAPGTPGIPVLPGRLEGGASVTVYWEASEDTDGNLEGYRLERAADGTGAWVTVYQGNANSAQTTIPTGITSVEYRVMAYDTYGETSAYAQTEELTVYSNQAPPAPASITVPNEISTGWQYIVSWDAVTDPDGDSVTYRLERSVKSGTFEEIYSGADTHYTDSAEAGWDTAAYRVCAVDDKGARSPYRSSGKKPVIANYAPVVTIVNAPDGGDFGVIDEPLSLQIKAEDKDKDKMAVTVAMDTGLLQSYESDTSGTFTVTFRFDAEQWQRVPNGEHVLTVTASDGTAETTAEVRFIKEVRDAVIMMDTPMAVSKQIEVCVISVTGEIPEDAEMTVEVTNNGNDASPIWEDATDEAMHGKNYTFSNKTAASGWAFNFRVTVHGGETRGYIKSIQGGFQ